MKENASDVTHKALALNLDPSKYGTFAEIGAGQEVARWFFHVGKAAGTVAKSVSAYDMAVSDGIYGPSDHYVSRQRLDAMLDHEYEELFERLNEKRGANTNFFVFADTSATQPATATKGGHSWMGVRFQTQPRSEPSQIIVHVQMKGLDALDQQEGLGLVGVNLIYGAFYQRDDPNGLVTSLMDGLSRRRVEIDVISFSGPAFHDVDNRLMSLQLVEQGMTDATLFTADGEVVQPAEVLSHKPVLIERGSFRPVTNLTLSMIDRALQQLQHEVPEQMEGAVVLMEMTLNNLMSDQAISHEDFLTRADILGALGKNVMISNYTRYDKVTDYLRHYTPSLIGMVMGIPALREVSNESYYTDLPGGILEGIGRLFSGNTKVLVYPTMDPVTGNVITADTLEVPPHLRHLYQYCLESKALESIREFDPTDLSVTPADVLQKIKAGDETWSTLVPEIAARRIRERGFYGATPGPKS